MTMMEQVLDRENLQRAWQRVKSNAGAPGVDGMSVEDLPAFARAHWPRIRSALEEGAYCPAPVRLPAGADALSTPLDHQMSRHEPLADPA